MPNSAIARLQHGVFFTEESYLAAVQAATQELVDAIRTRLQRALNTDVIEAARETIARWDDTYGTSLGSELVRLFAHHADRVRDGQVHIPFGVSYPQTMERPGGSVASASDARTYKYWAKQGFTPVLA